MLRVIGEDGARGKDWLRARGHHLCLTDTFFFLSTQNDVPHRKGNYITKIQLLRRTHTIYPWKLRTWTD